MNHRKSDKDKPDDQRKTGTSSRRKTFSYGDRMVDGDSVSTRGRKGKS